jgi:hypothetical protein
MAPPLTIDPAPLAGVASTSPARTIVVGDVRPGATAATCGLSADGTAMLAGLDRAKAAVEKFAGKNPKPAPRRYPLQRAGQFTPAPPGRNQPCPCGSGAKFKRCCGAA